MIDPDERAGVELPDTLSDSSVSMSLTKLAVPSLPSRLVKYVSIALSKWSLDNLSILPISLP